MTDRILIEGGSSPKFRISRPGKSVTSTDLSDFLLREDRETYRNYTSGSVAFGGSGTSTVSLSGFSRPPLVMLRSSDNTIPAQEDYFATISSDLTVLTIHNRRSVSRTIYYAVFANQIGA